MLLFSSILEYRVFVYTRVFLNRIASFEKLKNNNKYQNTISPNETRGKRTMHKITVKMLNGSQCSSFYLSLFA